MSAIGNRIKELRQLQKLNQTEFAKKLGLTQPSLSNIESGASQPSWETLIALKTTFGASLDWLAGDETLPATTPLQTTLPEVARIPLLDQAVMAGHFLGQPDPDLSQQRRFLVHPDFQRAIAVEVSGSSMEPTIKPRDILICTPVAVVDESFDDNYIYIVVSREGALVKRVVNRSAADGTLVLKSDNREFDVQTLLLADVLQLFRVRRRITANLSGPEKLSERMQELEQHVEKLDSGYRKLETKLNQYLR